MGPTGIHGGRVSVYNVHRAFIDGEEDDDEAGSEEEQRSAVRELHGRRSKKQEDRLRQEPEQQQQGGGYNISAKHRADKECAVVLHVANMWRVRYPISDFNPDRSAAASLGRTSGDEALPMWEWLLPGSVQGGIEEYRKRCLRPVTPTT